MGFTRSHYVKMAIRKLFHKKTFYAVEAGITERVICYRNAGIFVENYVRKLFHFLPETARCASVWFLLPSWLTLEIGKKPPTETQYRMIKRSVHHSQRLRIWLVISSMRRAIAK